MSKQAILAVPLVMPLLMFQWNICPSRVVRLACGQSILLLQLCTPNSKGSAHNVNPRLAYFTSASAVRGLSCLPCRVVD
ncbi:uncharacterized protein F5891DRAFT_334780 [Suillus fuscotomentosus]|uniref:Secreted protein n=1 Tax=Suillus fuscotomentosus TaxID=1912939 RepID=A0AAD4E7U8_9AGAM|nr:uncharacterized protein F5891DRAFT_334780 [Suillus fuscotomentosus]KAG1899943.1 hypothetical protein F5891DRAFT_334780 [Suillus fuscotomentosus]